jgi:hypothetical protein
MGFLALDGFVSTVFQVQNRILHDLDSVLYIEGLRVFI